MYIPPVLFKSLGFLISSYSPFPLPKHLIFYTLTLIQTIITACMKKLTYMSWIMFFSLLIYSFCPNFKKISKTSAGIKEPCIESIHTDPTYFGEIDRVSYPKKIDLLVKKAEINFSSVYLSIVTPIYLKFHRYTKASSAAYSLRKILQNRFFVL